MLEFNLLHNVFIRPPQVRTYTFPSSICHIYLICFRIVIGLCFVMQAYPQIKPNVIRVPQTKGLPPTSFRFHLAMDTLVLGYMVGTISPHYGLSPISVRPCWAHIKKDSIKTIFRLSLNYMTQTIFYIKIYSS